MLVKLTERVDGLPMPFYVEARDVKRITNIGVTENPKIPWAKSQLLLLIGAQAIPCVCMEMPEDVAAIVVGGLATAVLRPS